MSQQLAADATRSYIMVHIHAAASAANDQDNLFLKNDLFLIFKVQQLHFTGEMDKFVTFWCEISSRLRLLKVIKVSLF